MPIIDPEHHLQHEDDDYLVENIHQDCVLKYPVMAERLDAIGDKIKNNEPLTLMDAGILSGAAAHLRGPSRD